MAAPALGLVISHETGNVAARAGDAADKGADGTAPDKGDEDALHIGQAWQRAVNGQARGLPDLIPVVLDALQYLGQGEDTNQDRNEADAAHQIVCAEGETDGAAHGVDADGRQEESGQAAHDAFDDVAAGHARNDGKAEHGQGEIFRLGELQGDFCQKGRHDDEACRAEDSAERAGHGRNAQSPPWLVKLRGHGIAVEGRGHAGRCARRLQQDGADAAAVNGAAVNAEQHKDAGDALEGEGQGQQQGQAHVDAQARHGAEQDADPHPEDEAAQAERFGNHTESGNDIAHEGSLLMLKRWIQGTGCSVSSRTRRRRIRGLPPSSPPSI